MSIDEAIQKARGNENSFKNNHKLNLTLKERSPYYGLDCLRIADDNKNLAEWLEELKAYRANEGMSENAYRCVYNKAVDDFAEKFLLELSESVIWSMLVNCHKDNNFNDTADKIVNYVADEVRNTAEQLKVGDSE